MEGQVLGYQASSDEGTIKGEDGNRYTFKRADWKADLFPTAGQGVDFNVEGSAARDIFLSIATVAANEQSNKINAIVALLLTLFFGVIGTLVSRLALAKQDFGQVWLPALLQLLSYILVIIPVIGWMVVAGINIYFAIINYRLVGQETVLGSKYV